MKADEFKLKSENDLDELVRSSYGLSDSQLEEDLQRANSIVSDSLVPPSPSNGFEQIMEKKKRRNIGGYYRIYPFKPRYNKKKVKEKSDKRILIIFRTGKVLASACIMVIMLVCTDLTVSGNRHYNYIISERDSIKNDVALDNDENKQEISTLEEAYKKIYDETGITVLKLGYIPKAMTFQELTINKKHAIIAFSYKGQNIYLVQDVKTTSSSSNIISSRKIVDSTRNDWLNLNISVKGLLLENGKTEYSSEIKLDNAYYYITGVMELEEFKKIIKRLNYL